MSIEELRAAVDYLATHILVQGNWRDYRDARDALMAALDELDAWREIGRKVVADEGRAYRGPNDYCIHCAATTGALFTGLEDETIHHTDDCPVVRARKLLGAPTDGE